MKAIKINKGDVGKFVKEHKKEIACGIISIVVVGGVAYISYKAGYNRCYSKYTPKVGSPATFSYRWDDNISKCIFKITGNNIAGTAAVSRACSLDKEAAINIAKDILKDFNMLREVVEVPEVIANG